MTAIYAPNIRYILLVDVIIKSRAPKHSTEKGRVTPSKPRKRQRTSLKTSVEAWRKRQTGQVGSGLIKLRINTDQTWKLVLFSVPLHLRYLVEEPCVVQLPSCIMFRNLQLTSETSLNSSMKISSLSVNRRSEIYYKYNKSRDWKNNVVCSHRNDILLFKHVTIEKLCNHRTRL